MIFVGDDWAEDHHDIHVMDADGAQLASRRLPDGLPGVSGFHELMGTHAEEGFSYRPPGTRPWSLAASRGGSKGDPHVQQSERTHI